MKLTKDYIKSIIMEELEEAMPQQNPADFPPIVQKVKELKGMLHEYVAKNPTQKQATMDIVKRALFGMSAEEKAALQKASEF